MKNPKVEVPPQSPTKMRSERKIAKQNKLKSKKGLDSLQRKKKMLAPKSNTERLKEARAVLKSPTNGIPLEIRTKKQNEREIAKQTKLDSLKYKKKIQVEVPIEREKEFERWMIKLILRMKQKEQKLLQRLRNKNKELNGLKSKEKENIQILEKEKKNIQILEKEKKNIQILVEEEVRRNQENERTMNKSEQMNMEEFVRMKEVMETEHAEKVRKERVENDRKWKLARLEKQNLMEDMGPRQTETNRSKLMRLKRAREMTGRIQAAEEQIQREKRSERWLFKTKEKHADITQVGHSLESESVGNRSRLSTAEISLGNHNKEKNITKIITDLAKTREMNGFFRGVWECEMSKFKGIVRNAWIEAVRELKRRDFVLIDDMVDNDAKELHKDNLKELARKLKSNKSEDVVKIREYAETLRHQKHDQGLSLLAIMRSETDVDSLLNDI